MPSDKSGLKINQSQMAEYTFIFYRKLFDDNMAFYFKILVKAQS